MNIYQFKNYIHRENLHISEWMSEISISGETYSEILRQKFNLYYTSLFTLLRDYMVTRRSSWGEDKEYKADQVKRHVPE